MHEDAHMSRTPGICLWWTSTRSTENEMLISRQAHNVHRMEGSDKCLPLVDAAVCTYFVSLTEVIAYQRFCVKLIHPPGGGNGYTNGHHNVSLSISSDDQVLCYPSCAPVLS